MAGSPDGGWNIADCVERAYDLEGMDVGVLAAGRIGLAVLRRLAPFDVRLHYTDTRRLAARGRAATGLTFHPDAALAGPAGRRRLHPRPAVPETYHLFDDELLGSMRRGSYIVNTARGADHGPRRGRPGPQSPASWPATRATSGTRNPRPPTTRGGPCPTTP